MTVATVTATHHVTLPIYNNKECKKFHIDISYNLWLMPIYNNKECKKFQIDIPYSW